MADDKLIIKNVTKAQKQPLCTKILL